MFKEKYPPLPILIVDDEQAILDSYKMALLYNGINNFILCNDSTTVMDLMEQTPVSLVVLDLFMPHVTGRELLERITENYANIPVIIITGSTKTETAVECMNKGAFYYLVKPVDDNRLIATLKIVLELNNLKSEISRLSDHIISDNISHPEVFSNIITRNSKMLSIFKYIEAIAESPKPVLITGESGTGKEAIAGVIHTLSGRSGNCITCNIGGLDDMMFSDTLFGHKKGAFTGADDVRKGFIEQAKDGTLFLDEIGEMEPMSQVKLLRLLQENQYYALGSDVVKTTNARIIVATNVDLQEMVNTKAFRKDLYFRLNTHHIHLPPLRERQDDIPFLTEYFLEQAAATLNKKKPTAPAELFTLLKTYSFPGNIRELQSVIFDAVSRHEAKVLSLQVFKEYIANHTKNTSRDRMDQVDAKNSRFSYYGELPTMKEVEDFLIKEALEKADGNQSIAASLIGISQATLSRRLKKSPQDDD